MSSQIIAADLRVTQITASNAEELVQQGPDAAGGIGDWFLSNGTLCAVVSNVDHESDMSASGGVLIDLGFCGRADDHYVAAQDLLEGSRNSPIDIDRIDISNGDDSAAIITLGGRGGIVVETRYSLNTAEPQRLQISKKVRRVSDRSDGFAVYTTLGLNYYSMETFILATQNLKNSSGFKHEDFVRRGPSAFGKAAQNADTIISISPRTSVVPISYGWRMKSVTKTTKGISEALPYFTLSDRQSSAFLIVSDNFSIGDGSHLGPAQLLQLALMELKIGEQIDISEEIFVSANNDVASITDLFYSGGALITGSVSGEGFAVHLDLADGTPFSHMIPDADKRFSVRAPAGRYKIRVLAPAGRSYERDIVVEKNNLDLGTITLDPPNRLYLPTGEAMRLVFKGIENTEDPDFQNTLTEYVVFDDDEQYRLPKVSTVFLAGIESDSQFVDLKPGKYQVFATRGIEYSLEKSTITIQRGQQSTLEIAIPRRIIESEGYIAADLHVHSGPSTDNAFSTVERLRTFAAEHAEVMVASEHDTIFSFQALVDDLQLNRKMVTVTGTEMTSEVPTDRLPKTIGHANFFPLEVKPHAFRRGAPNGENRRMREVLHEMQHRDANIVSQLNHARASLLLSGELPDDFENVINPQSYLDAMGTAVHPYNPTAPINSYPNNTLIEPDPVSGVRDIDFDVMELMNGPQGRAPSLVEALRLDWISFLRQGIRIVGSANSDSHTWSNQVGLPRNMVATADDSLEAFDVLKFSKTIKQGNMYGTTGPLLNLALEGAAMGSMIKLKSGRLQGKVVAADWVGADSITVQINGVDIETQVISDSGKFAFDLNFEADAFVTVEIHGSASLDYQAVYPDFEPYAFSNPIYVDSDGDGKWTPPGLPR